MGEQCRDHAQAFRTGEAATAGTVFPPAVAGPDSPKPPPPTFSLTTLHVLYVTGMRAWATPLPQPRRELGCTMKMCPPSPLLFPALPVYVRLPGLWSTELCSAYPLGQMPTSSG